MHEEGRVSKQEGDIWLALGLMSGTSMDGIDVALIETDGTYALRRWFTATYPYSDTFRAQLRAGLADAAGLRNRDERPGRLKLLEQYLTELHAEAVGHFLTDHSIEPDSIDVIGFHGQTVLHRPEDRLTVQLGDGPLLASLTGRDVVYDMRAADVAAGGHGAPLVPAYHRAALSRIEARPLAVLNLGGVGNVTWIGRDGHLIAFDTGPASAMIDDWMMSRAGKAQDENGEAAARGRVNQDLVTQYLLHSHFGQCPPKSLDRNAFPVSLMNGLSVEDGAATLTAFSAAAVGKAREHFPETPEMWIVAGGGRRNATLMSMIAEHVEAAVVPAEAIELDGDGLEAEAWAYLAVRSRLGMPITFPGTTGVSAPLTGGVLAKA
jgi:anhydro-N-acetylmuramic acid kinase